MVSNLRYAILNTTTIDTKTMFFILPFFLFGLLIGSFLNVVIVRVGALETLLGRSFCRTCKQGIAWYDNIPLASFLLLGGKCRKCSETISWQYPLVELSTAVLFALIGAVFFQVGDTVSWVHTLWLLGVVSCAVVVFAYDAKHMEIPTAVIWFGIIWTIVFLLWLDWARFSSGGNLFSLDLYSGLLAGLCAFFVFFLTASLSRERWMGLGDAYVVLFIGLVVGWPMVWVAIVAASFFGSLYGLGLMVTSGVNLKSQLPFGPFLMLGMVTVLLCEPSIRQWLQAIDIL